MYRVYDKHLRKVIYCETLAELRCIAFAKSLEYRAAVYFNDEATEQELIEDLEGVNCRVEKEN